MKKIFKSLTFPAISILLILAIYGGLSIISLDKKASAAQSDNTKYDQRISELEGLLGQYSDKLNQVIATNNNLSEQLAAVANSKLKTVTVATPPEIKTITQTETIYQTEVKQVEKNEATVTIQNVGSYKVELEADNNAFTVLQRAAAEHGLPLTYDTYSFGVFITGIGGIVPSGNQFWSFYYNGTFSNVGASDQPVKKGDNTFWQLSTF